MEKINIPDKHFHMSENYKENSLSQQTIGNLLIENVALFSQKELENKEEIEILDIACGPGNLTNDLEKKLEEELHSKINLTGLDYSEENIKLLSKSFGNKIKGIVGSFYELPIKKESQDVIVSNEGLHWQPPFKISEIIYTQLPDEEKKKYESFALSNFKKAIQNIFNCLKEGGISVLQFGHEGQLNKLWDLINETLKKEEFKKYKEKVNFPLFYPKIQDIEKILTEVGFKKENIEIKAFYQDLTEDNAQKIVGFLRAFTEVGFSKFFDVDSLNNFYKEIEDKINGSDINEFRKDQWHRTLIKLKK